MAPLRVDARGVAKDLAIRLGLRKYRHLDWSLPRWDRAYSGRDTDAYGELSELARYSLLSGYLRYIGSRPKVLDVGCGIGLLRQRVAPEDFSEYVGIDHAQAAVDEATRHGYERSRFLVGDPRSLELERFDVVVCNEMLYFVPDYERLLEVIKGLLVERGHLLVSIFGHPGDFVLWRCLEERFELVDRVHARNERNRIGWWGWSVAWLRKR
jgi:SAM-dependent methyltransferase